MFGRRTPDRDRVLDVVRELADDRAAELVRARERIAQLERQIDELHAQGLRITPPPPPPDPASPTARLPRELARVIAGIDDPDARAEFEAAALEQVQQDVPFDRIMGRLGLAE